MKQEKENPGLLKKATSCVLVCLGGFFVCTAVMAALARLFMGSAVETAPTLLLVAMGAGLVYGGSRLWSRWLMVFGIFLSVIGLIFSLYMFISIPGQSPGFVAVKKASVWLGMMALCSGIFLIITQNRCDHGCQVIQVDENGES